MYRGNEFRMNFVQLWFRLEQQTTSDFEKARIVGAGVSWE